MEIKNQKTQKSASKKANLYSKIIKTVQNQVNFKNKRNQLEKNMANIESPR